MLSDLRNEVNIVVLTDSGNNYGYVPESHIEPSVEQGGILYREKSLIASLGVIKDGFDEDYFISKVNDFIIGELGIDAKLRLVDNSVDILLTTNDSISIESDRRSRIDSSLQARYKACVERNTFLEDKLKRVNNVASNSVEGELTYDIEDSSYLPNLAMEESMVYKATRFEFNLINSIGVEYMFNRYAIVVDDNTLVFFTFKYGELRIIETVQLGDDLTHIHLVGTREHNVLVVCNDANNDVYAYAYNEEFENIASTKLLNNLSLRNNVVDYRDNKFLIGYTDDKYAYCNVYSINSVGEVYSQNFTIDGIGVGSSYIDEYKTFNIALHEDKGILTYNDRYAEVIVSGNIDSLSSDDDFKNLHTPDTGLLMKSILNECYLTLSSYSNSLTFDSINQDNNTLDKLTLYYDEVLPMVLVKTLDRSYLVLRQFDNYSIEIKKVL
jgi:ribosome biogenesis protein Nip4